MQHGAAARGLDFHGKLDGTETVGIAGCVESDSLLARRARMTIQSGYATTNDKQPENPSPPLSGAH